MRFYRKPTACLFPLFNRFFPRLFYQAGRRILIFFIRYLLFCFGDFRGTLPCRFSVSSPLILSGKGFFHRSGMSGFISIGSRFSIFPVFLRNRNKDKTFIWMKYITDAKSELGVYPMKQFFYRITSWLKRKDTAKRVFLQKIQVCYKNRRKRM